MSRRIMTLCPPKEGLKNDMSTRMIICPPKTRYAHQDDNIPTKKDNMSGRIMIYPPKRKYVHQG